MTEIGHLKIVKTVKLPYFNEKSSDFDEFGKQHHSNSTVGRPNINIFKIQDDRRPPFQNRFFVHKSAINGPISVKFCTEKQNNMMMMKFGTQQHI